MAEAPAGAAGGTPTPDPAGDPPAGAPPPADPSPATPEEWAAERARMQAAVKAANKEAEKTRLALKAIEDRDKTQAEKDAARAEAAEAKAAGLESEILRFKVAAEKNLPAALAERLKGATEDEMRTDADALLALVGTNPIPPGSLDGGRQGTPPGGAHDMSSLIRQRAGRG